MSSAEQREGPWLHQSGTRVPDGRAPRIRHKRASRACSLRASARIEAVVRAGRRCWSQGGDERRRPPNRALLLSPRSSYRPPSSERGCFARHCGRAARRYRRRRVGRRASARAVAPAILSQLHDGAAVPGKLRRGGEAEVSFGQIDGRITLARDEWRSYRRHRGGCRGRQARSFRFDSLNRFESAAERFRSAREQH